ncbi:transcriptional regulator FeaR [Entomohabitans teleogrylli]|uniref:transcriptional regulator FeaR n=1 Tax=Entomohabitans teleogrylli TaxID=1384589 RepID=UPI00073D528D|nr:transcriptional regulator FeaR [Entomohabitans teleogrylli]
MNLIQQNDFASWLSHINRACGPFAARPLAGPFHGDLEEYQAGQLKLSTVTVSAANLYRSAREVRQHAGDWFYTVFQLAGEAVMEQEGQQALLRPGDLTLIDAARPCSFTWQQPAQQISLLLPRAAFEQPCRSVACARRLSGSLAVIRLSHQLLAESLRDTTLTAQEREAALEAVICLLRPAIQARDLPVSRRERLFQQVMALIDEQIQSEQLRPEWIASESGMSVRSLYRMFAENGLVVAQYIKHRRLDFCARALRDASPEEKLAAIAWRWGFTDHSHFSTAFRQRFGVSPGEYRKRHQ